MNKKKLSVVMAGAMLATTVAPIMAATESEMSVSDLGLLIKEVRETLLSKKFSNVDRNNNVGAVNNQGGMDLREKSVYFVTINGVEDTKITDATKGNASNLQSILQEELGSLKSGQTVEIWERGNIEENGKVYATELKTTYSTSDMSVETAESIVTALKGNTNIIAAMPENSVPKVSESSQNQGKKADIDESGKQTGISEVKKSEEAAQIRSSSQIVNGVSGKNIVIVPNKSITINLVAGTGISSPIVIKPGDKLLDFTKYINTKGEVGDINKLSPTTADFCGFAELQGDKEIYQPIANKLVKNIKLKGQDPTTYKVSDLYNGVMLTTEGHDLLAKLKEVRPVKSVVGVTAKGTVAFTTLNNATIGSADYPLSATNDGKYGFKITVTENGINGAANTTTVYTITGENKKDAQTLLSWLKNQVAKVDILAGKDRYETAVEVAKEYSGIKPFGTDEDGKVTEGPIKGNIVLVNGNALVDGLSASPLASKLNAPMLLVENNRIPKVTMDYIISLSKNVKIMNLSDITINIVGGTSVVSKDVEKELKSYGFSVKRFGGKNREDTSMKVAKAIDNNKEAFVVGAEGEADAMSIASVASRKISTGKNSETNTTPIIVSNKNGLSEDTLESLNNKNVTVLGGEAVVSKTEFDNLKEAVGKDNSVIRVAGKNRQETNAQVISKYYADKFGNDKNVLVAKDGQRNKNELIDALTVSAFAAEENAPIVLATNKLDKAQINALELNARQSKALYQVGHGVSLNVVKELAQMLGLN